MHRTTRWPKHKKLYAQISKNFRQKMNVNQIKLNTKLVSCALGMRNEVQFFFSNFEIHVQIRIQNVDLQYLFATCTTPSKPFEMESWKAPLLCNQHQQLRHARPVCSLPVDAKLTCHLIPLIPHPSPATTAEPMCGCQGRWELTVERRWL